MTAASPTVRRAALAFAVAVIGALCFAPTAFAHAQLLGTSPARGAVVKRQPAQFIFEFDQPVQGGIGAVRVFNASGARVDNSQVDHPNGNQHWMGVGLKPNLPKGTYIATYRVVSADTHIVFGGSEFSVGHPGGQGAVTVAGLLSKGKTGAITEAGFGAVRALDYATIALALGALAFLALVWIPELPALGGSGEAWEAASRGFARRTLQLLAFAIVLGIVVNAVGIIFQGAEQAGVSFWAAANSKVIGQVLATDFGTWWGTRMIAWVVLGVIVAGLAAVRRRSPVPILEPVSLGADGLALDSPSGRLLLAGAALPAAYIAITPALSGHASSQSPRGVLFPVDVIHVVAMSVWLGGLVMLLFALPAATRRLEPADRSRLLAGTLARFSPIALICVLALVLSGVVQAYIHVRALHALFDTGYGRAVVAKTLLLLVLVCLAAVNRERLLPQLRRIARERRPTGETGVVLRRVLRAEVALIAVVLGVTSALVSYAPPVVVASGPVSVTRTLGPSQLNLVVQPATVGANQIHIYLVNSRSGAPFTGTKELDVKASLPSKGIGPLPLSPQVSGPGHWTVLGAQLVPAGTWQIQLTDRTSEFDEYLTTIEVPVR